MKFILLNINEENENIINKIQLDNNFYINELSFAKSKLRFMESMPKSLWKKVKYKLEDKKISSKILNAIGKCNNKWCYITSTNFTESKYMSCKLQELLGYKLVATNELDTNIFKYIQDYLGANSNIRKHELKILVVANNSKNLNMTLIESLIKEYKTVNIYLKDRPSSYILKRIKDINKSEGATIEILKNERKAFLEYNVVYFIDDARENYPRFRLNSNAFVLDIKSAEQDKYNSNVVFLNKYIEKENSYNDNIRKLLNQYKTNELATVIKKILINEP